MSFEQVLVIVVGLFGGLGLFLFGMQMMSEGMQKAAGDKLRKILEVLTSNQYIAVVTGAVTTVLVQSSSTTTVMVVGFVNAGLMNLNQAVGTILGANIGTTVTAQMISFNLGVLALPAIAVGFGMQLLSQKKVHKYAGQSILGFGLLFLGMMTMSDSLSPLRDFPPFIEMIASFSSNPFLGVLAGAAFTVMVQSSSASTGVIVALSIQGLLPLASAMPLLLGTNVGTSVTAVLACIGTGIAAKRAAVAHVLFNVIGVVVFLILLKPFTELVAMTSNEVPRQIANGHTIFNVANTLIVLPFTSYFVALIVRLVPGENVVMERGPKYLDKRMQKTPAVAIGSSIKEMIRMGVISREMLQDATNAFLQKDRELIQRLARKEEVLNELEKEVTVYLADTSQQSLTQNQSRLVSSLMHVINDIERIGDLSENISELAESRIEEDLPFSDMAIEELTTMYEYVDKIVGDSIVALETGNTKLAMDVLEIEDRIDYMEKRLRKSHIGRINDRKCFPVSGVIFLDIISTYERIADHAQNIARVVLDDQDTDE
ncbi:phosphate:Na+ symporter [Desulfitispora alkaliphila]|uniref:Na/Pi cotransporter family protein n=1 Tax=Desulfitispora alkaliphila TaxID=622674 RepID=UPI003D215FFA